MRSLRWILAMLSAALLSACAASGKSKASDLEATLMAYEGAIRWGNIEAAVGFLDPASQEEHPVSRLTLERFQQLQIVGYREQAAPILGPDGLARQMVLVEMVNIHSQSPRQIMDRQVWRYDAESKRWLLTSGLPDLNQQR